DDIIPSQETQEELKEIVKSVLPSEEGKKKSSRKTGVGSRKTEDGSRKSEDGSPKTENRKLKKPGTRLQTPDTKPQTPNRLSDYDVHLFREGKHFHLYKKFGTHVMEHEGL